MRASFLQPDHIIVRMRAMVWLRGRLLTRHGQFGAMHVVTPADALRVVLAGEAKLPGGVTRRELQEHCDALLQTRCAGVCTDSTCTPTNGESN